MLRRLSLTLAALSASATVQAGSIQLTYTGGAYNTCESAPYSTNCSSYSLSMTIVTNLSSLDNLTFNGTGLLADTYDTSITSQVTSFGMTDGTGLDVTPANAVQLVVDIATDANGNVTEWAIFAHDWVSGVGGEFACSESSPGLVASVTDYSSAICGAAYDVSSYTGGSSPGYAVPYGGNWGSAGTFSTSASSVPEPASLFLLASGLGALATLRRRTGARSR